MVMCHPPLLSNGRGRALDERWVGRYHVIVRSARPRQGYAGHQMRESRASPGFRASGACRYMRHNETLTVPRLCQAIPRPSVCAHAQHHGLHDEGGASHGQDQAHHDQHTARLPAASWTPKLPHGEARATLGRDHARASRHPSRHETRLSGVSWGGTPPSRQERGAQTAGGRQGARLLSACRVEPARRPSLDQKIR